MSPDTLTPSFTEKATGLHELVSRHQMEVSRSVMIGDSVDDAIAAREAGMTFIAAEYGYGEVLKQKEYSSAKKIKNLRDLTRVE